MLAPDKKLVRRAVAKAPLQSSPTTSAQIVQFPLEQTLAIKKGQYIGLSVPSWAPALQLGLGTDSSWRASRATRLCTDPAVTSTQTALLGNRSSWQFGCLYQTTRLTYSATFIPSRRRRTPGRRRARAGAAGEPVQQAPGFSAQKLSNSPPPAVAPPVVD